jgi:hypothetical protein
LIASHVGLSDTRRVFVKRAVNLAAGQQLRNPTRISIEIAA